MKLTELNPVWLSSGGDGVSDSVTHEPKPLIEKSALDFDCPCGCKARICVPVVAGWHHKWNLSGDNFDNLSLTPSIQRTSGCQSHFHVTNGEIVM